MGRWAWVLVCCLLCVVAYVCLSVTCAVSVVDLLCRLSACCVVCVFKYTRVYSNIPECYIGHVRK